MGTINDSEKNIIYSTYDEYDSSVFILNDNDLVINPKNDVKSGYSPLKALFIRIVVFFAAIITIAGATITYDSNVAMAEEECGVTNLRECVVGPIKDATTAFTDGVKGIFCAVGGANGSSPEMAAGGVGGLFTNPIVGAIKTGQGMKGAGLDTSKPYTAYEKYGTSGTNWTFNREKIEGIQDYSCFPVDKVVSNLIANGVFSVTEMVSVFAAWSYGFATGTDKFDGLIDSVDTIMGNGNDGGLVDTLYLNYLTPLILLGALWLFWYGIVKRSFSKAGSGLVWMLVSAISSLAILYNASGLIGFANGIVQGVVAETTGSIGGIGDTNRGKEANGVDDMCALPGSSNLFSGNNGDKVERIVKCRIWEAFIYFPWATGQFGIPPNQGELDSDEIVTDIKLGPGNDKNMDVRAGQLDAQSLDYTIAFTDMGKAMPKKIENYKKIEKYMTTDDTARGFVSTWAGNDGMNRLGIAIFSIVAAIGGTLIIISISVSMIVYQLGTIFLMLVAPLFLLLGAHPGFGRGIALKWAELLVESVLKRIVLAIFISVIVSVFIFLVSNTGDIGFIETIFLLIAMSIAGMMYKGKFTDLVSRLDFGGTQTGMEGGESKVRSVLLGTAGAAAGTVGALGAAGTAGKAASRLAATKGLSEGAQNMAKHAARTRAVSRGVIGGYSGGASAKGGLSSLSKGAMAGRFNSQGSEAKYDRERGILEKEAKEKASEQEKQAREEQAVLAKEKAEKRQAEQDQIAATERLRGEQDRERQAMDRMNLYNAVGTIGGMLGHSLFGGQGGPEQGPAARPHGGPTGRESLPNTSPTTPKPNGERRPGGAPIPGGKPSTPSSEAPTVEQRKTPADVPTSQRSRTVEERAEEEEKNTTPRPEQKPATPRPAGQSETPPQPQSRRVEEGTVMDEQGTVPPKRQSSTPDMRPGGNKPEQSSTPPTRGQGTPPVREQAPTPPQKDQNPPPAGRTTSTPDTKPQRKQAPKVKPQEPTGTKPRGQVPKPNPNGPASRLSSNRNNENGKSNGRGPLPGSDKK